MATVIKTFPIIQCSPPLGKPAEATSPRLQGERWPRSTGNHSLGPSWGQQGDHFCPSPHWPGREETIPELARTCTRTGTHAHTHPRTNPCSVSQLRAHRAGEGGGQRPHSGWRGSHLRITLGRKAAQKHMDTSTVSEHSGHHQGHRH